MSAWQVFALAASLLGLLLNAVVLKLVWRAYVESRRTLSEAQEISEMRSRPVDLRQAAEHAAFAANMESTRRARRVAASGDAT